MDGRKVRRKSTEQLKITIDWLLRQNPTLYLHEMQRYVEELIGTRVSSSTISRICRELNYRRKRARLITCQRLEKRVFLHRRVFREHARQLSMNQMVFIDECHFGRKDTTRRYGRAIGGNYAVNTNYNLANKTYSLFAAITRSSVICRRWISLSEEGERADAAMFISFMRELSEHALDSSIFVLDNARIHRTPEVMAFFETIPQMVLFLSPYSPDYNPIEFVFGEVKKALKSYDGASDYLPTMVNELMDNLTEFQLQGYYSHCERVYEVVEEDPLRPD